LQEYDQYELQHQVQQDDHPLEDDQHQALHPDDQEEVELDDRYPEVAELDDQTGLSEVVAADAVQQEQLLAQLQQQELVEHLEQRHLVASLQVQEQELPVVPALQQVQPSQQVEQK
jgi:hypothetical protein